MPPHAFKFGQFLYTCSVYKFVIFIILFKQKTYSKERQNESLHRISDNIFHDNSLALSTDSERESNHPSLGMSLSHNSGNDLGVSLLGDSSIQLGISLMETPKHQRIHLFESPVAVSTLNRIYMSSLGINK